VDLHGLQGVKYDVNYTDKKGKTRTKTMVELDVYVGVGSSNSSAYQASDVNLIQSNLVQEYNNGGKLFKVGGQFVEFKFNMHTFDVDKTSINEKAQDLRKMSVVETASDLKNSSGSVMIDSSTGQASKRRSIMGVAIGIDPSITAEEGSTTSANRIGINPNARDRPHTEAHEVGHFMLGGSPNNPNTVEQHDAMGGIFFYRKVDAAGNTISPTQSVSKSNVKEILNNVPVKK
jgi:hypothetical protein